jgi:osmotically-inducible protein OsmY
MTRESITNQELGDHELTHLVIEELSQDARVPIGRIGVAVVQGDIILTGTVDCIGQKLQAEQDAKRTPGFSQIINDIVVLPERPFDDTPIAASVMEALRNDGRVLAGTFDVACNDGIITLRGEAVTEIEKRVALDDVSQTYGVRGVIDEVIILPRQAPSDRMLEQQVAQELSRAPFLDERRVLVHVDDGIACLSGTVDFPQQLAEVERIARDVPGIQDVKMELAVQRAA